MRQAQASDECKDVNGGDLAGTDLTNLFTIRNIVRVGEVRDPSLVPPQEEVPDDGSDEPPASDGPSEDDAAIPPAEEGALPPDGDEPALPATGDAPEAEPSAPSTWLDRVLQGGPLASTGDGISALVAVMGILICASLASMLFQRQRIRTVAGAHAKKGAHARSDGSEDLKEQ